MLSKILIIVAILASLTEAKASNIKNNIAIVLMDNSRSKDSKKFLLNLQSDLISLGYYTFPLPLGTSVGVEGNSCDSLNPKKDKIVHLNNNTCNTWKEKIDEYTLKGDGWIDAVNDYRLSHKKCLKKVQTDYNIYLKKLNLKKLNHKKCLKKLKIEYYVLYLNELSLKKIRRNEVSLYYNITILNKQTNKYDKVIKPRSITEVRQLEYILIKKLAKHAAYDIDHVIPINFKNNSKFIDHEEVENYYGDKRIIRFSGVIEG